MYDRKIVKKREGVDRVESDLDQIRSKNPE